MSDRSGPAFPVPTDQDDPDGWGMTMRDYFAGQFLSGYVSSVEAMERAGTLDINVTDAIAIMAYEHADSMIKARGES
jgi:hypothetical protein